jgi:hypothetical protein
MKTVSRMDSGAKKSALGRAWGSLKQSMSDQKHAGKAQVVYDEWGDEVTPVKSVSSPSKLMGRRPSDVIRTFSVTSLESPGGQGLGARFRSWTGRKRQLTDWSDSDSDSVEDFDVTLGAMGPRQSNGGQRRERRSRDQRRPRKLGMMRPEDIAQAYFLVTQVLDDQTKDNPWWRIFQQKTGLFWLRKEIGVRRIRLVREPPDYPGIYYLTNQMRFEVIFSTLIILNAVSMGVDSTYTKDDTRPGWLGAAEHLFIMAFLTEWSMRLMSFSWAWLFEPMSVFDTLLVWVFGVLVTWIIIPFFPFVDVDLLQRFSALRVLRIARLIRAIRIMPQFFELWTLVNGMMNCAYLCFWAFVVIGFVQYSFGILVMETVAKSEVFENDALVQEHFGDMASAMFTLFQFMTFDS